MRRPLATILIAGVLLAAGITPAYAHDGGRGPTVYGITTDQRVVTFRANNPRVIVGNVPVLGLGMGETVIGFDRRPLTNTIYAVTRAGLGGRLYALNPVTGAATFVATLVTAPRAMMPVRLPILLSGMEFGVDFNPAADALRIVSDAGQNLRVIPSERTAADGTLLRPGDTFTDGTLNRNGSTAIGVTGAAYTNNDNDPATSTQLFDIDHSRDELLLQNPPNDGTLTVVGRLGQGTDSLVGFDVQTRSGINRAFASLSQPLGDMTVSRLVRVNLGTGAVTDLGIVGTSRALRDIAL